MQEVHLSIGFIGMYICETVYGTLIVEMIEYLVLESLKRYFNYEIFQIYGKI